MKADISARTFRAANHYSAVIVGQGQVLVDSALNEQQEIVSHRVGTTTTDVIGPSGVPKDSDGFRVTIAPDGHDLLIGPGRIYIDGICCANEPAGVGAAVSAVAAGTTTLTVDAVHSDGVSFAVGQWVDAEAGTGARTRAQIVAIVGFSLTLAATVTDAAAGARLRIIPVMSLRYQPNRLPFDPFAGGSPFPVGAGAHRVELDVWERHLGPAEDPSAREIALGDAESPTRMQTVWQVRLTAAGPTGGGSCALAVTPPRGTLAASTAPGPPSDEACELPDEAGFRGLENQLYRCEVHSTTATEVVLKWSRDNASTASRIVSLGTALVLEDPGLDATRGFQSAAYVEVTDDFLELEHLPADLIVVKHPPRDSERTVTLQSPPTKAQTARRARARRWDGILTVDLTVPPSPLSLERGLEVTLGAGVLRPGDYWLIPARTSNRAGGGTILWPRDDSNQAVPMPPEGIEHHLASLAIVDANPGGFVSSPVSPRECRAPFSSLTEVQRALDSLNRESGCCTVTAVPGPGWEKVFEAIGLGEHASVCFPVGEYPAPAPVVVRGKGMLVLKGVGAGTVIAGAGGGTALTFADCGGVVIDSLTITGARDTRGSALRFTNCGDVVVRSSRLAIGPAATKQSSCLSTMGGTLHVADTSFSVGDLQIGLLAVDTAETVVRGCRFGAIALSPSAGNLPITSATKLEKLQAKRLLVNGLKATPAAGGHQVGVTIGNTVMSFSTPPALAGAWAGAIDPEFGSMRQFKKGIDSLVRSVFAGRNTVESAAIAAFIADRLIGRRRAVISQALVVGGRAVGDVLIEDTRITDAVQGIHVGASHRGQPRSGPADAAVSVTVHRNRVAALVPAVGARDAHGIFVGNASRIRITENEMSLTSLFEGARPVSDGIRVYGYVGPVMAISENVVDKFKTGISLTLLSRGAPPGVRMWSVDHNLIGSADAAVVPGGPLGSAIVPRDNAAGTLAS